MNDTKNSQKFSTFFRCEKCDYNTCRKSDLMKHFNSKKHNDTLNDTKKLSYMCECGKIYKYHSGYFRHKKTCNFMDFSHDNYGLDINENMIETTNENSVKKIENKTTIKTSNINNINNINSNTSNSNTSNSNTSNSNTSNNSNNSNEVLKDLVCQLISENNEIKNTVLRENYELRKQLQTQSEHISELIPKVGNNNTTNNNLNQKFNINVFLNEQCKNAINIDDFIKSLEISIEKLDFTKNNSLTNGLSNAIIENMNKLGMYERPLHCTDLKRETLYIKDNNSWEKDKNKSKIKKVIKDLSHKQFKTLHEWTENNPDFKEDDTKKEYFVHAISTIGKDTKNIDEKIIKSLCTNTYIKDNNE